MVRVSKLALAALCLALASSAPRAVAFSSSSRGAATTALRSSSPPAARRVAPFVVVVVGARRGAAPSHSALSMSSSDDATDAPSSSSSSSALTRLPDSAVEVIITAPGSATRAAYDRACAEASKQLSIPGFRKGARIPPAVIESTMAAEGGGRNALRERAVNSLVGQLVEPALRDEHGLDPIGQPTLDPGAEEIAEGFVPGEPVELRVKCDVWPEIRWKDVEGRDKPYLGLRGTYKRKPFDQERFDRALTDLRERYATLSPAEEGAALSVGDACTVDMAGYMADAEGNKGEPLPAAASGDDVEVVLGEGRYMEGLVEGLVGARVGDEVTVSVSFPENLKDKTLAGKRAIFDVTVKEASHRTVPEVTDEFAAKVRDGLTAESLREELRKAVDSEDAKEFVNERNDALGLALSDVMDAEVPDTLITDKAREQFAMMMTDFRDQGMDDDEIKRQITPENFLKYKELSRDGIVRDFRISMAVDEIARLENIEVPAHQVDEQMGALKKEMAEQGGGGQQDEEEMDDSTLRSKVEATLQRRMVFDYLAEHADLDVEYVEEAGSFDPNLLNELAEESLARERGISVEEAREEIQAASAESSP